MTRIHFLLCLWTLIITQTVYSDIQFLERAEGDSVVFSCVIDPSESPPYGIDLKRKWLQTAKVMYMYKNEAHSVLTSDYHNRINVSGDPSRHSVTVTVSELRAADTDRYYCLFHVDNPSGDDIQKPANTEFFLLVHADAPGTVDIDSVDCCAGDSAVLPCVHPLGDSSPVEGVVVKRQRGQAPVEVLHHSRTSTSLFDKDRVQLSFVPGPSGVTYSVTLKQMQPEDSGLFSCQLLLKDRPPSATLGRRVFFVSVEDGPCGCSSYSTLIYALSSSVAILFILLLTVVCIHRGKRQPAVKSPPQAPIYEEMCMVKPQSQKLVSCHLEEMESEYKNCSVKKSCPENHYESPGGPLAPRDE